MKGKFVFKEQLQIADENLWKIVLLNGSELGYVLVYVDDLLILATRRIAEAFHGWVRSKWQCSDLEQALPQKALRFL